MYSIVIKKSVNIKDNNGMLKVLYSNFTKCDDCKCNNSIVPLYNLDYFVRNIKSAGINISEIEEERLYSKLEDNIYSNLYSSGEGYFSEYKLLKLFNKVICDDRNITIENFIRYTIKDNRFMSCDGYDELYINWKKVNFYKFKDELCFGVPPMLMVLFGKEDISEELKETKKVFNGYPVPRFFPSHWEKYPIGIEQSYMVDAHTLNELISKAFPEKSNDIRFILNGISDFIDEGIIISKLKAIRFNKQQSTEEFIEEVKAMQNNKE